MHIIHYSNESSAKIILLLVITLYCIVLLSESAQYM